MARVNALHDDPVLRSHLERRLGKDALAGVWSHFESMGRLAAGEYDALAREANANPPRLGADGRVVLHDSYLELSRRVYEGGIVRLAYRGDPGALPRLATFGLGYLFAQAEQGLYCPVCLTDGTAHLVQRFAPEDARRGLLDALLAPRFDAMREGAMWMTERIGGSDVSDLETAATRAGAGVRLRGEKFFCSNANAHLSCVLARAPEGTPGSGGLGLYLLDARDGAGPDAPPARGVTITRLKDKLGTRSMATGEVRLDDAAAIELGGEGDGLRRMVEMLTLSRVYNAVASVAAMRRCLVEAVEHARTRRTFGAPLLDHPLHRATLVEMMLEWEGALALVLELAQLLDKTNTPAATGQDRLRLRMLVPVAKLSLGQRAVDVASTAVEALGGIGYTHDTALPRFFADAQVLPIWEGTTNVLALDVLRAATKEEAHRAVFPAAAPRLQRAARADPELARHLSMALSWLAEDFVDTLEAAPALAQLRALDLAQRTARGIEAVLLLEHAHETADPRDLDVARAYAESHVLGTATVREELTLQRFHAFLEGAVPTT